MGFGGRKPILPAPTESLVDSGVEDTGLSTDLATDLSRRTDRTSATIPDDGSPVTISTGSRGKSAGKHTKGGNSSQASLLIEYYEGERQPGSNRKPSLRVRVRPSAGKSKDKEGGYIAVSQEASKRNSSYTKRIPLGSRSLNTGAESTISLNSVPVDIEIGEKRSDMSDLSASPEARYIIAPSDISSMPADSMLGTTSAVAYIPPHATSSILSNSELDERSDLRPPIFPKERNLSHEKITQKAFEKYNNRERESAKAIRSGEKSRSRSGSGNYDLRSVPVHERRRRSGKMYPEESSVSGGTESMVSNSVLSAGAKSYDDKSVRSGASNITNPKLLQTVEDAIRRLILPELKEIKRYGSQRTRQREDSYSDSDNSIVKEKAAQRQFSSGSKSRRRVSTEGSGSRRRHHRDVSFDYDSQSEISSPRRESISSAGKEYRTRSSEKGHRNRDMVATALAGGALTAAALHHQDSNSTLDRRRRRRRSKSRSSRSASVAESEEIYEKPPVPPMPFRSEVGSDITRSSLLSSNTVDTTTPTQRDVREVVRGSTLDRSSPTDLTPTQAHGGLKQTLGTMHRNVSGHDLNTNRNSYERSLDEQSADAYSPETFNDHSFTATGLLTDPERIKAYERNLHQQHPIRRGLSPIQSVASYATTEPHRHSAMHTRSIESINSERRRRGLKEEISTDSFMSASPSAQKIGRPQGINLENRSEIMHQHDNTFAEDDRDVDEFYDEQHGENDRYRQSYASDDPRIDVRHLTNYTDDSTNAMYLDKAGNGHHVVDGFGSNPEYITTPPGVESAVASLIEPSVLDVHQPNSPRTSAGGSTSQENVSIHSASRGIGMTENSSSFKDQVLMGSPQSFSNTRAFNSSPPQSSFHTSRNSQQEMIEPAQNGNKDATSPESEITTNPSVIQGPIGGLSAGNRDHWPYGATPDRSVPAQQVLNRDLAAHAPDLMPEALNLSPRQPFGTKQEMYIAGDSTTPGLKDEGYATGDNPRSPGLYVKRNAVSGSYSPEHFDQQDDPFVTKRNKYMSGLSQGMSPLYDSATGRGKDRIQSKDVVALMDHLTVRDCQRNARDSEILVTLVRSAAEMRNSFEDMKKFISEQDGLIMNAAERQHEKTQRIIGGPRPQPASARATQKSSASQDDDLPSRRKNIFKRALQGLGSKNATELQNIEQMLMQLLDDVEDLKVLHSSGQPSGTPTGNMLHEESTGSMENARALTDTGYEPEGQAGTSSTGDRSGNVSNQSSRHEYRIIGGQKDSVHRVSTVIEGDEDEYDSYGAHETRGVNRETALGSHSVDDQYRQQRGQLVPYSTPPRMSNQTDDPWGADNHPHSAEQVSSRKNKSVASALLPKLLSRWSKTTASTEPRLSSQQKPRPYSQVSRSGSDLAEYTYDPQPADRLRSNTSLQEEQYHDQENRPPSPLVPSQISDNPKYQGWRNSKNLEHPQPRQGPTGRYQHQLENEAQYYDQFSPTSQESSQWGHQHEAMDQTRMHQTQYQPQPPLSPITDAGHSEMSDRQSLGSNRRQTRATGDEPLVPQRPAKIPMSPTYVDHVAAARAGSPAYDKSPVAALQSPQGSGSGRKPSGPRPLNSPSPSGQNLRSDFKSVRGDFNTVKKTRFRGSPYHVSSSEDVNA